MHGQLVATFEYSVEQPRAGRVSASDRWDCELHDAYGQLISRGHSDTRAGALQAAAMNWPEGNREGR